MAQKLHSQYGFPYNNLQVLLGGWNTWKEKNGTEPAKYPIEVTQGSAPANTGSQQLDVSGPTAVVLTPQP